MVYKPYEKIENDMFGYRIEDYVGGNYLVKFIDTFIDGLELEQLREQGGVKVGARRYDPCLMLKVWLYGYAKGRMSSRKVEDGCQEDVGFIYLCRGNYPSYHTLSTFRVEHGALILEVFVNLLSFLQEQGISRFGHVIIDKTTMEANASKAKMVGERHIEKLTQGVQEWLRKVTEQDEKEEREAIPEEVQKELKEKLGRYTKEPDQLIQALRERMRQGLKRVSVVDSQARLVKESGKNRTVLGYGMQVAVDQEGFIGAVDVVQQSDDHQQLGSMVKKAQDNTGQPVQKADADSGYFDPQDIKQLESQGVDTCVPDPGMVRREREKPLDPTAPATITIHDFTYKEQTDSYLCPAGCEFTRAKTITNNRPAPPKKVQLQYRRANNCGSCSLKGHCVLAKQEGISVRMVVAEHFPFTLQNCKKLKQPPYVERRKKRGARIEPRFGHFKFNLGFRKFFLRGLFNVNIEAMLLALANNFIRLINKLSQRALLLVFKGAP